MSVDPPAAKYFLKNLTPHDRNYYFENDDKHPPPTDARRRPIGGRTVDLDRDLTLNRQNKGPPV